MDKRTFSLKELANLTNSELSGDENHIITGASDLESANESEASFLSNPQYDKAMLASKAGVVFVSKNYKIADKRNFIICDDPSSSFQQVVDLFFGKPNYSGFAGIHQTAVLHEQVRLGKNITIGPNAIIDQGVTLGDNVFVGAGSYIGPFTTIGQDSFLHPRVTIRENCIIGDRVIIQPGAVIGSCGFGYATNAQREHIKLNQVGTVTIEDDVEIGANTTIDRARLKSTVISKGSKIDNLVQIGHNVIVGPHNIIVAQTGIAGSSKTGKYVVIGGQVAVAGHLSIADKSMIAGKSGISKSLTESGKYGGIPVMPIQAYNRNSVFLRNIELYVNQIKELELRISKLESQK